jgi:leucyl-tRNA synthetase
VASLYELTNAIERAQPSASRDTASARSFCLLRPWRRTSPKRHGPRLGASEMIADAPWPKHGPRAAGRPDGNSGRPVNGKLRDTLEAVARLPKDEAEALALALPKVQAQLGGNPPRK